jgi:hypothetical protein
MRRAVVLCELQGVGRAAAAKQLGISEGTLSSRLARARKALKDRLARRGFTLVMPVAAVVSAKLAAATVGLANGAVGVVPAAVWALSQEAMKMMAISKLNLGAVLVAAVIGLTGFGLSASGNGDDKPVAKAKADPPAAADAKPPTQPVATVNGQDISRAEFGEYLIRKHGAKEITLFVNKKIIEHAAADKSIKVKGGEIEAQFLKEYQSLGIQKEEFVKSVLTKHGKTEAEWRDDVTLPRLLLEKMCEGDVAVTDGELRDAFARKFGETRKVQLTTWSKDRGVMMPKASLVHKAAPDDSPDTKALKAAAFALKKKGEESDWITITQGRFAVTLIEIIPANTDAKFEDEKAALRAELLPRRMESEVHKRFAKLREQAEPVYHIEPAK